MKILLWIPLESSLDMEGQVYCKFNFQRFIYLYCTFNNNVFAQLLHYGLTLYCCTLHNLSSLVAHPGIPCIQNHCSLHSIHAIHSKIV